MTTKDKITDLTYVRSLGEGAVGLIHEVTDSAGNSHALKVYKEDESCQNYGQDGLSEIDIISRIEHPHIVKIETLVCKTDCKLVPTLGLVLPLGSRTLFNLLSQKQLTTAMFLPVLFKLASALKFLHDNNILHLDIKLANVIIADGSPQPFTSNINAEPLLIDFGLAIQTHDVKVGKELPNVRVTIDYRPPEILNGSKVYCAATDVWSFGILLLYCLSRVGIYRSINLATKESPEMTKALYNEIVLRFTNNAYISKLLFGVDINLRSIAIDLLSKMLTIDPAKRISMTEVCAHPFFANVAVDIPGKIIDVPIVADYAGQHRNIMKVLIMACETMYHARSVELLFSSVDLFKRVDEKYKTKSDGERMLMAVTCIHIMVKLLSMKVSSFAEYVSQLKDKVPNISVKRLQEQEIQIVIASNGILNCGKVFNTCDNIPQLRYIFENVIMSQDITEYSKMNLETLMIKMRKDLPIVRDNKSTITVKEFLKILN